MHVSFSLARSGLAGLLALVPLAAAQVVPPDRQEPDTSGGPGSYRGPGDTVPAPSPAGLTGGAASSGTPAPLCAPAVARASLSAPAPPGVPVVVGPTQTQLPADRTLWQTWWEFNKDPYQAIRESLFAADLETGRDDFFLGDGSRPQERQAFRPSPGLVFETVAPALLRVLQEEQQNDLIGAALVALGRLGTPPAESELAIEPALRKFVDHANANVSELAVLALGIHGDDTSVFTLSKLLEGDARAQLRGRETVPERQRAFAAYALGLIGSRTANEDVRSYIVHQLTRALRTHRTGPLDVPVACVQALGLVPLAVEVGYTPGERIDSPTRCRQAQIAWLLDLYEARSTKFLVRAHVPTALARLVADVPESTGLRARAAQLCLEVLGPRSRAQREIRQSAALALGALGDADDDVLDREIRRDLQRVATATGDPTVRHFAHIALAQVGARPGTGVGEPLSGRDAVATFLRKELHAGRSTSRAWTALATGLHARHLADVGVAVDSDTTALLVAGLRDAHSTRDLGAFAIATGLGGAAPGTSRLVEVVQGHGDDSTAGYAALGLGLMRARSAAPQLVELVENSRFRPLRISQAAIALALLGDRQTGPRLADMLADAGSFASQSALAQALGQAGDARVVPRLVELLEDQGSSDLARAFAAYALGVVCEQDMLPWRWKYSCGVNYLAATPSLTGNRGILDLP